MTREERYTLLFAGVDDRTVRAFHKHIAERPYIWMLFKQFAHEAMANGFPRYSSNAILHRMRWEIYMRKENDEYKVNHVFSPYFARQLAVEDERFLTFFKFSKAKGIRLPLRKPSEDTYIEVPVTI